MSVLEYPLALLWPYSTVEISYGIPNIFQPCFKVLLKNWDGDSDKFGGDDTVRMTKLEGDKTRDRSKAKIIKSQKYKEYKINVGVSDEEI